MKFRLVITLVCVAAAWFAGCANPINAYTAQQYYSFGVQAERAGDLTSARRNYSRAFGNAQMGNLGPKAEAYYLYEVARVTGYAGDYAASEQAFRDVLALIQKANGEADALRGPALAEYSRLLHDTGQHRKAIPIYEQAVPELEKLGAESTDPLGFAAFLDDYAESLNAAGLSDRAAGILSRSSALKATHPNEQAHFQPRRYKGN